MRACCHPEPLEENDFRDFMAAARQVWDRQDAQIESLIRSAERDVKLENNAAIPDDHADFLGLIALFNHSPAFLKKMAATQRIIAEVLDDQEKLANPKATHTREGGVCVNGTHDPEWADYAGLGAGGRRCPAGYASRAGRPVPVLFLMWSALT